MKKIKPLLRTLLSCAMALLCMLGLAPATVTAAGTYTLHVVDDLQNSDALYRDYVKENHLTIGYITNLTTPMWNVTSKDFKLATHDSKTYLYTSPARIPDEAGRANAVEWDNVATITYKDAGYYGENKSNTFDIVFELARIVTMKPYCNQPNAKTAPYFSVALTDNTTGSINSNSYVRDENFEMVKSNGGPFTVENWKIKLLDKNGNKLSNVLLVQTYRDIDIEHTSNDPNYETFNEGFYFADGFADDTYVNRNNALSIYDKGGKAKARYEAASDDSGDLTVADQRGWAVAAIVGGEALLQWSGQACGSFIANTVFREYPNAPDPVKTVDKEYVQAHDEIAFTVTEDFPVINPSNCPKAVTFRDTLDAHLTPGEGVKVMKDGVDVTDDWTITIDGQTVTATANTPGSVEGNFSFSIPATVKEESLDGATLVTLDGRTFAQIPNTAYITVTDQYDEKIELETPPVYIYEDGASIDLKKSVDRTHISEAVEGDELKYAFAIKNTGKFTLHNVVLLDDLSVSDLVIDWNGSSDQATGEGTLSPGETVQATASYAVTAEDLTAETVVNTATVSGLDPNGNEVTADSEVKTTLSQAEVKYPEITLVKDVDKEEIAAAKVGDVLTYTVTVTNTGDTTLQNIALTDSMEEVLSDISYSTGDVPEAMEPSDSFVMTTKYAITQEDINQGRIVNEAGVTAQSQDGADVHAEDDAVTILGQKASDEITKKVSVTKITSEEARVGYEIRYDFTASNTGNVPLYDVVAADEMLTNAGIEISWDWDNEGILLPGETISGYAVYALTQEDIDAGVVENTVILDAKDPQGNSLPPVSAKVKTDIEPEIIVTPKVSSHKITKTVDKEVIDKVKAGDIVNYTFTYTNTGETVLSEVTFADELLTDAGTEISWNWPGTAEATLAPGASVSGSASYKITQADIDRGEIINKILAYAKDPDGNSLEPCSSEATTQLMQNSKITVKKSVDKASLSNPKEGTVLTYTFKIANEGTTTLTAISLEDSLTGHGLSEITMNYPDDTKTLLPGQSMSATATYALKDADIKAKKVENLVTAKAKDPGDREIISDKASVTTTILVTVKPTATPTPTGKPSPTPTPSQPKIQTQTVSSPKTGDNTVGIWASVGALVVIPGILFVLIKKRKAA